MFRASNATQGLLGHQMPHRGIGASNLLNLLGRCWQELTLGPTLGPRVLGSKLGFRGLCKASKASNWSKPEKGSLKWESRNFEKKEKKIGRFWNIVLGIKCHLRLLGRQMPPRGYWGVKCHPGVLGRQMSPRGYWGVKCHPGVLGRQMPPRGIGASNATRGYWGVKCHLGVLGRQMPPQITGASKARGVKGPESLTASKIRGVKGPSMGKGHKGH